MAQLGQTLHPGREGSLVVDDCGRGSLHHPADPGRPVYFGLLYQRRGLVGPARDVEAEVELESARNEAAHCLVVLVRQREVVVLVAFAVPVQLDGALDLVD